jgi:hypothetical protein
VLVLARVIAAFKKVKFASLLIVSKMVLVVDDSGAEMGTASILSLLQDANNVMAPATSSTGLNRLFMLKFILKN